MQMLSCRLHLFYCPAWGITQQGENKALGIKSLYIVVAKVLANRCLLPYSADAEQH